MGSDKIPKTGSIVKQKLVTAPWREELIIRHVDERGGSVSTFQHGIDAYERYLRTTNDRNGRLLFLAIVTGHADADDVVDLYSRKILGEKKDNPPTIPFAGSGFSLRTGLGNIAMVSMDGLHRVDLKKTDLIVVDERRLGEGNIPRLLLPGAFYFSGVERKPWRPIWGKEMFAQAGGMLLVFDWQEVEFRIRNDIEGFGSFSPIDHLTAMVTNITEPEKFHKAWNAHLEAMLVEGQLAVSTLRSELANDSSVAESEDGSKVRLSHPERYIDPMRKLNAFMKASARSFQKVMTLVETWEWTHAFYQIAKLNNTRVLLNIERTLSDFDELLSSDIESAITAFEKLLDPLDHIEKVYQASGTPEWIRVDFEDGRTKFVGEKSIALRKIIDEIVYQAGTTKKEKPNRISFAFDEIGMTVFDKSGGKALAPIAYSGELKDRLRGLVKEMGPDVRIDFMQEDFEDGSKYLLGIDIRIPKADESGPGGGIAGNGNDKPLVGGTDGSGAGFRGVISSMKGSTGAKLSPASLDPIGVEGMAKPATPALAKGAGTMLRGAAPMGGTGVPIIPVM